MKHTNNEDEIPEVSVIIPVYNTERYVQQAVDSIRRQTLQKLEIIIINDGSTDHSSEILRKLAAQDSRIRLFEQENQGLSVTRNVGLEHATGEYIYLMDSDDLLEENALELCLHKCNAEALDFVFFDADSFYDEELNGAPILQYSHTRELEDRTYGGCEVLLYQLMKSSFTPSACLNFMRRDFIETHRLRFFPHILHEDQLFTALLYLNAGRVGFIRSPLFHRRLRAGSIMTSRFAWRNMASYLTVTDELNKWADRQEHIIQGTVQCFLPPMLDAAVWQAHVLPLHQRLKLLYLCTTKYKKYVSWRTLAVLMVKRKTN
ncbi:glycosyltransferase [Bacteroides sp.]